MINYGTVLTVDTSNYRDVNIQNHPPPDITSIQDGQVIMKLEKFAYTSNNTTYAVVGDLIGYWKFFPVEKEGWGIIPCWGFATVIASKHDQIPEGMRLYGYFPMSSHLIVIPGHIGDRGFTDITEHRLELPMIYNRYINCATDPLYRKELEAFQSIFRPLFTTSFLIHDQFYNNDFYNSDQIILTSASSKTALGLANCLQNEKVKVIGLTSPRNIEMVKKTNYYDEVYTYDNIPSINRIPSSYVDFSGNHDLQLTLQKYLGTNLDYVCLVGLVHWEQREGIELLPQKGTFFFAPTYAAKLIKEIGSAEFGLRLSKKYETFIGDAIKWIDIKVHQGGDALTILHHKMTDGDIIASEGHIVRL